jgi:S-DNA-T family DNA segregation ATPase FtsK/SpoIIIE
LTAPRPAKTAEDQLYPRPFQVVAESQKASTSYVQRQLRIGYNSAARLIERMESEGLVSRPDHVGRREVLIDAEGHAI